MADLTASTYPVRVAAGPLDAAIDVPGSKSIANRALVCAALAAGTTTLRNVPGGDDTVAMLECIEQLGAGAARSDDDATCVTVHGTAGALRPGPITLDAQLAGTTSRFVTALCALGHGTYVVDGRPPLRARPMGPLHTALAELGAGVNPAEGFGHLPVTIGGIRPSADATGRQRTIRMRGDISSQFITAVMLIAPYLPGGVRIELTTPLVSRPYVAITAAVMAAFGVGGVVIGEDHVDVPAGRYAGLDYSIEPDASSASYPLAAAAICSGSVRVKGLRAGALQGDAAFADVLASMGCTVTRNDAGTTVTRDGDLRGVTIDMTDLSDLVPTLAAVAPFATSATTITGVGFIRAKESDRLGDLAHELRACGVDAIDTNDGLVIQPGVGSGTRVETHHDHRLAMAFGIIGLRLDGVRVADPAVVSKSWPEFWTVLETLGGQR